MSLYLITNQHQPEDCSELSKSLTSYYDAKQPSGKANVYCNCGTGEHKMFFLIEAAQPDEALQTIPPGFLRTANTVSIVEEAYDFATRAN